MKRALITGITGQDGSYLAEHLLHLGYSVVGTIRSISSYEHIAAIQNRVSLIGCDVTDLRSVTTVVEKSRPDEIYNLAGQSFQPVGWKLPDYTLAVNAIGVLNLITAMQNVNNKIRLFQASAAGMFGPVPSGICNESTAFNPQTPYDISKQAAHQLCRIYRDKGLYISTGILFSHESPRRGFEMLSRKISQAVADWAVNGKRKKMTLGDIDMSRDWGCALDFVKGMHLTLQAPSPADYVFGSGRAFSIADFLDHAVLTARIGDWQDMVEYDKSLVRGEKFTAVADCTKAMTLLGWRHETAFQQLVEMMVDSDIERMRYVQTSNVV